MPSGPPAPRRNRRKSATTPHSALRNTVRIGHELGAQFAVYWPGSLGYYVQGAIEETRRCAGMPRRSNAACERDIEVAEAEGPPDAEALPGSQAVRAAGGDPAAHQRRHARLHRLGPADASGDGRPESRISARTDVGRARRAPRWRARSWPASSGTSISTTATA